MNKHNCCGLCTRESSPLQGVISFPSAAFPSDDTTLVPVVLVVQGAASWGDSVLCHPLVSGKEPGAGCWGWHRVDTAAAR